MALRHAAVFRNPGSYVASPASSSVTLIWRRSTARIVPSWMGSSVDRSDRAVLDGELVRVAGSVVGDGQGALRHANRPGKWLAKDNHGRTADGNGRTALSFAVHMAQATAPKPATLYPTRSAAGALLGQQLP